jgi:hypothetical protein
MKKPLLALILVTLHFNTLFSQIAFDSVWVNIDFENGADSLITFGSDSTSSTFWTIGTPSKTNFDSAYSPGKAIVTDTTNVFQPNTNIWFQIPIVPSSYDSSSFFGTCPLNICFEHQRDLGLPHSGGWITIFDDDESMNISDGFGGGGINGNNYSYGFFMSVENAYSNSDFLFNGETGFRYANLSWVKTCYSVGPAFISLRTLWDTVYVRFSFASDLTPNTTEEGWMIDNIQIGKGTLICSGGLELEEVKDFRIYPNPATENVFVEFENIGNSVFSLKILDIQGRAVHTQIGLTGLKTFIDVGRLSSGLYFFQLLDGDNKLVRTGKILMQ